MPRVLLTNLCVPTVAALPSSPYDGQEIIYVADATNGIVWRFRYRAASGAGTKWEFVGGTALTAYLITDTQWAASPSYVTSNALILTVPLAGNYDLEYGIGGSYAGTDATGVLLTVDISGVGQESATVARGRGAASGYGSIHGRFPRAYIAAGGTVKLRAAVGAGTLTGMGAYIAAQPVRVA